MIAHIKGKVTLTAPDYVIVDVMGIGYRVFTPHAGGQLPRVDDEVQYFTYLHVREDALQLYGFRTLDEYELFMLLITVSGIGPKVALGMVRSIAPASFCQAVRNQTVAALTALPGIGKKTAERLIVELKDKVGVLDNGDMEENATIGHLGTATQGDEAVQALTSLGYSLPEAVGAVRSARKKLLEGAPLENVIKQAFKEVVGQGNR